MPYFILPCTSSNEYIYIWCVCADLCSRLLATDAHLTARQTKPFTFSVADDIILSVQGNIANTYQELGRLEEAMCLRRDVYSGDLRLHGEEHPGTLIDAHNYANSLLHLKRFGEVKSVLRKTIPVAQRVRGEDDMVTLGMRQIYAEALYADEGATLDDMREAVTMLDDIARTARRVFGGSHPVTAGIDVALRNARAVLRAREETQPSSGSG